MIILYILSCLGLALSLYGDDAGSRAGKTLYLEKNTISTKQLSAHFKAGLARKRVLQDASLSCPPCPPPPPFPISGVVPTQNPHSPAITFYPDNSITNSPLVPPQTIGARASVTEATMGSNGSYIVHDPSPCAGLDQVAFPNAVGGTLISFDRNLKQDNKVNVDLTSFLNNDGDFSYFGGNEEMELRYDKFTNRFFFALDTLSFLGDFQNTGITFGVSDRGSITEETNWTIVTVFNANVIPDKNHCPGDEAIEGSLYEYTRASVDKNAYYIACDITAIPSGLYVSTTCFVVQKESLFRKRLRWLLYFVM